MTLPNAKRSYWDMADMNEQVDENEYAMAQLAHSLCSVFAGDLNS